MLQCRNMLFCNKCQLSHKPQLYLSHPFRRSEAMHTNTYAPTQYYSHILMLQVLGIQYNTQLAYFCSISLFFQHEQTQNVIHLPWEKHNGATFLSRKIKMTQDYWNVECGRGFLRCCIWLKGNEMKKETKKQRKHLWSKFLLNMISSIHHVMSSQCAGSQLQQ